MSQKFPEKSPNSVIHQIIFYTHIFVQTPPPPSLHTRFPHGADGSHDWIEWSVYVCLLKYFRVYFPSGICFTIFAKTKVYPGGGVAIVKI